MLTIHIPGGEAFDEINERFVKFDGATIQLEHSLISISKWESKWHKAFLGKKEKTAEEIIDYVRCMTITQNVKDDVYIRLTEQNLKDIQNYIEDSMTATHFYHPANENVSNRDTVTSELIYCWMISLNIPFECQRWHLNRLLTLIETCTKKNGQSGGKKMSPRELAARNRELNAQRRARLNSKG